MRGPRVVVRHGGVALQGRRLLGSAAHRCRPRWPSSSAATFQLLTITTNNTVATQHRGLHDQGRGPEAGSGSTFAYSQRPGAEEEHRIETIDVAAVEIELGNDGGGEAAYESDAKSKPNSSAGKWGPTKRSATQQPVPDLSSDIDIDVTEVIEVGNDAIDAEDNDILEEADDEEEDDSDPVGATVGEGEGEAFTVLHKWDGFARAKVANCLKRIAESEGRPNKSDIEILVDRKQDERRPGRSVYRAAMSLPLAKEWGSRVAVGVGKNKWQAETLAAMHAEHILDALGYPIFTSSEKQTRHAEIARGAGRWAPMPSDSLRSFDTPSPKPIRVVRVKRTYIPHAAAESKENDLPEATAEAQQPSQPESTYTTITGVASRPSMFAVESADNLDVGARKRAFEMIYAMGGTATKNVRAYSFDCQKAIVGMKLPLPEEYGLVKARGKSFARQEALVAAAMHAELIVDALGFPVFPKDPEKQRLHAEAARAAGRYAPMPGDEPKPPGTPVPPPLFFPMTSTNPESQIHLVDSDGLSTGGPQESTNYRTITSADNGAFVDVIHAYLDQAGLRMEDDTVMRTKSFGFKDRGGSLTWRTRIKLPLANQYGKSIVAMGVADSAHESVVAACANGIERLALSGIQADRDKGRNDLLREAIKALVDSREAAYAPSAGDAYFFQVQPDKLKAGRDKFFIAKVAVTEERRRIASGSGDVVITSSDEAIKEAKKGAEMYRTTAPRGAWDFEPDNKGFIVAGEPDIRSSKTDTALSSPRAKERVTQRIRDYSDRRGVDYYNEVQFTKMEIEHDGKAIPLIKCTIQLPVPLSLGRRVAVGIADVPMTAQNMAEMHAELLLDTLLVPIYDSYVLQRSHAGAARRMGRVAPLPGWPVAPSSTSVPPPLWYDPSGSLTRKEFDRTPRSREVGLQVESEGSQTTGETNSNRPAFGTFTFVEQLPSFSLAAAQTVVLSYVASAGGTSTDLGFEQVRASQSVQLASIPLPIPQDDGLRIKMCYGLGSTKKEACILCMAHAMLALYSHKITFLPPDLESTYRGTFEFDKAARWVKGTSKEDVESWRDISGLTLFDYMGGVRAPTPPQGEQLWDLATWATYVKQCEEYVGQAETTLERAYASAGRVMPIGEELFDLALDKVNNFQDADLSEKVFDDLGRLSGQNPEALPFSFRNWSGDRIVSLTLPNVIGNMSIEAMGRGISGAEGDLAKMRCALHAKTMLQLAKATLSADSKRSGSRTQNMALRSETPAAWSKRLATFMSAPKLRDRTVGLYFVLQRQQFPDVVVEEDIGTARQYIASFRERIFQDGSSPLRGRGSTEEVAERDLRDGLYKALESSLADVQTTLRVFPMMFHGTTWTFPRISEPKAITPHNVPFSGVSAFEPLTLAMNSAAAQGGKPRSQTTLGLKWTPGNNVMAHVGATVEKFLRVSMHVSGDAIGIAAPYHSAMLQAAIVSTWISRPSTGQKKEVLLVVSTRPTSTVEYLEAQLPSLAGKEHVVAAVTVDHATSNAGVQLHPVTVTTPRDALTLISSCLGGRSQKNLDKVVVVVDIAESSMAPENSLMLMQLKKLVDASSGVRRGATAAKPVNPFQGNAVQQSSGKEVASSVIICGATRKDVHDACNWFKAKPKHNVLEVGLDPKLHAVTHGGNPESAAGVKQPGTATSSVTSPAGVRASPAASRNLTSKPQTAAAAQPASHVVTAAELLAVAETEIRAMVAAPPSPVTPGPGGRPLGAKLRVLVVYAPSRSMGAEVAAGLVKLQLRESVPVRVMSCSTQAAFENELSTVGSSAGTDGGKRLNYVVVITQQRDDVTEVLQSTSRASIVSVIDSGLTSSTTGKQDTALIPRAAALRRACSAPKCRRMYSMIQFGRMSPTVPVAGSTCETVLLSSLAAPGGHELVTRKAEAAPAFAAFSTQAAGAAKKPEQQQARKFVLEGPGAPLKAKIDAAADALRNIGAIDEQCRLTALGYCAVMLHRQLGGPDGSSCILAAVRAVRALIFGLVFDCKDAAVNAVADVYAELTGATEEQRGTMQRKLESFIDSFFTPVVAAAASRGSSPHSAAVSSCALLAIYSALAPPQSIAACVNLPDGGKPHLVTRTPTGLTRCDSPDGYLQEGSMYTFGHCSSPAVTRPTPGTAQSQPQPTTTAACHVSRLSPVSPLSLVLFSASTVSRMSARPDASKPRAFQAGAGIHAQHEEQLVFVEKSNILVINKWILVQGERRSDIDAAACYGEAMRAVVASLTAVCAERWKQLDVILCVSDEDESSQAVEQLDTYAVAEAEKVMRSRALREVAAIVAEEK